MFFFLGGRGKEKDLGGDLFQKLYLMKNINKGACKRMLKIDNADGEW